MAVLIFFVLHWQLSVFLQSFFQHRYGAHGQFTMSKRWERVFHAVTWVVQGPSYLNPRTYAILHRMHHAYADTERDPHSPVRRKNFFILMWHSWRVFGKIKTRRFPIEKRFEGGYPEWRLIDDILDRWPGPILFGALYALYYVAFATHWWMFLFLPVHWVLGLFHGTIVNWAGHKVGYRNYAIADNSKNTLVFDVLTMGELFQNNHHKWSRSPNFGVRWFEIDPAWQIIRVLGWLGVVDLSHSQKARWEPERARSVAPGALPAVERR